MLDAFFSNVMAKKGVSGARKSIQIELQRLQNPSKKQFYINSASEDAFEPAFFFENL